jgi:hypothetical protein
MRKAIALEQEHALERREQGVEGETFASPGNQHGRQSEGSGSDLSDIVVPAPERSPYTGVEGLTYAGRSSTIPA